MNSWLHLLFTLTAVSLLLVCGVFWGLYFALSRSYQVFEATELAKIARTIVANLEVPMRNIALLCLGLFTACVVFYPVKSVWNFWALCASLLFVAGALVITTAIEVPINNQVVTWTKGNVPDNWQQVRNRWQYYNVIRVIFSVLGFLLFAAAIIVA
jgi:uncharacterized membrane protein